MDYQKVYNSNWDASRKLLSTRLSGLVSKEDVDAWIQGFYAAAAKVAPGTKFLLFSNLHGYEAVSPEAHKAMREIIPAFLAGNGMMPGYARLFPELKPEVTLSDDRQCIRCAHVHHDSSKIERYHNELATPHEDFFTEPDAALNWLLS